MILFRVLLTIELLFLTTTSYSQREEIYKLTFSDTSNFGLTTTPLYNFKRPAHLRIIGTTDTWHVERFWIKGLTEKSPPIVEKIKRDEHHPYNHSYLFKDTALANLISDSEKISLWQKSGNLKPRKINFNGKNYQTISSASDIIGFYFTTTEPLFTDDGRFAFIDLTVYYKQDIEQEIRDTYFGRICIVYKKEQGKTWRKIEVRNNLIL
jgi:hypothetical protein